MQPQENSPIKKIIVIAVCAVFILLALYFFFFKKTEPQIVLDQFGNPTQAQVVGQDLVDLLSELQNVKLDDTIFRKQAFIDLSDYSITLPDQPRGRSNPFASIGGGSTFIPKAR